MVISLVAILYCLLQVNIAQTTEDSTECVYVYGNWTDCVNYAQTRTVSCLCGGVESDMDLCNMTQPVVQKQCECKWKWSKWSKCTTECGGGNTTRVPVCYCNDVLVGDDKCDINFYFGRETVSCNEYECGDVPALNKLYWIQSVDVSDWPIDNAKFNCSLGFDPVNSPKGSTYYDVLSDDHPSAHAHPEWYYLAKEWIAAKLNLANGVQFPLDGLKVITEVGDLLEDCSGYAPEQIPQIYALKEKLGRLNNNIGGLSNVDSQMSVLLGGNRNGDNNSNTPLTFILAIVVPLVAVLIVAVALGFTVYYVREKTAVAKDKFESEDEEDAGLTVLNDDLTVGEPVARDAPNESSDD